MIDWEDVTYFVALARCGTLSATARALDGFAFGGDQVKDFRSSFREFLPADG